MKAFGIVKGCYVDSFSPPDSATITVDFTATEDPRQGQVAKVVLLTLNESQIATVLRQAVRDFINDQRGAVVIGDADVRLS